MIELNQIIRELKRDIYMFYGALLGIVIAMAIYTGYVGQKTGLDLEMNIIQALIVLLFFSVLYTNFVLTKTIHHIIIYLKTFRGEKNGE